MCSSSPSSCIFLSEGRQFKITLNPQAESSLILSEQGSPTKVQTYRYSECAFEKVEQFGSKTTYGFKLTAFNTKDFELSTKIDIFNLSQRKIKIISSGVFIAKDQKQFEPWLQKLEKQFIEIAPKIKERLQFKKKIGNEQSGEVTIVSRKDSTEEKEYSAVVFPLFDAKFEQNKKILDLLKKGKQGLPKIQKMLLDWESQSLYVLTQWKPFSFFDLLERNEKKPFSFEVKKTMYETMYEALKSLKQNLLFINKKVNPDNIRFENIDCNNPMPTLDNLNFYQSMIKKSVIKREKLKLRYLFTYLMCGKKLQKKNINWLVFENQESHYEFRKGIHEKEERKFVTGLMARAKRPRDCDWDVKQSYSIYELVNKMPQASDIFLMPENKSEERDLRKLWGQADDELDVIYMDEDLIDTQKYEKLKREAIRASKMQLRQALGLAK